MNVLRPLILASGLLIIWQSIVFITGVPHYILPGPSRVFAAILSNWTTLTAHFQTTFIEIVAGLLIGVFLGTATALIMFLSPLLKKWLLPVLVISQAVPVFALAPILVLWLGYGMTSKIGMAVLIIYFPVASSFYYGMQRTDPDLLELAQVMGGSTINILRYVVIPAALPPFASGVRVAAAVAPIGAVVGEWVGSSAGLGFYMLHANARMQIDIMFAALVILSATALLIYFSVDFLMDKIVFWESKQGTI